MASNPKFSWQTIEQGLLQDIYDSDQAMYPAPQLTYDRLKSWVDACPELCLCLQRSHSEGETPLEISDGDAIHGFIIVLPLRQPDWDRLRHGDIEEHDVEATEMFPPRGSPARGEDGTTRVGLHVFHIERFSGFAATWKDVRFTTLALEETRARVAERFRSWEIVGYSALTATKQGNAAFKRLGFHPSNSTFKHQDAQMVERMGNGVFSNAS